MASMALPKVRLIAPTLRDDGWPKQRGHVLLEAVDIDDGVGGDVVRAAACEDVYAGGGVDARQMRRSDLEAVGDLRADGSRDSRVEDEGEAAGELVVLPDVGGIVVMAAPACPRKLSVKL